MFRMRMQIDNPNARLAREQAMYRAHLSAQRAAATAPPKPSHLNAPMVDRVHKAKPGCSACGKKVA
jgi:hypothetical protein